MKTCENGPFSGRVGFASGSCHFCRLFQRQNVITTEVLRVGTDTDDGCKDLTCPCAQGIRGIIASQLVDRWRGYALQFKSKDAIRFLLCYSFIWHLWQAVFPSETLWRFKKWANLGLLPLAELCFIVVEVSTVGDVGSLHQQSKVFVVLGKRLKLRERQSKLCLCGHILPYIMMCHSTVYFRQNK